MRISTIFLISQVEKGKQKVICLKSYGQACGRALNFGSVYSCLYAGCPSKRRRTMSLFLLCKQSSVRALPFWIETALQK